MVVRREFGVLVAAALAGALLGCSQLSPEKKQAIAEQKEEAKVAAPAPVPPRAAPLSPAVLRERLASAESRFGDGMEAYYAGNLDGAIAAFREVARLRPFLADSHLYLARCYRGKGYREAALAEFEKAVDLDANHKEALLGLAELSTEAGKSDEALALYRRLATAHPDDPRVLTAIATHYSKNGRDPRAPLLFRKALLLRPDYLPAFRGLVDYFASKGTPTEITQTIETVAAATHARIATLCLAAGEVFVERDQFKLALDYFRRAGNLEPYSPTPYEKMGDVWLRLGRPRDALAYLRTGLDYNPNATSLRQRLADAYRELGDTRLAALHYRRVLHESPRSLSARLGLVDCYMKGDAVDYALAELTRARKLHPDNSAVHYRVGLAYEKKGFSRDAVFEYRRALELDPNLFAAAMALENLGPK